MTLICYEPHKFNNSSRVLIDQANMILDEYAGRGEVVTLRQLYYQFVARALLENKQANYKRLGDVIAKARVAGEVSWTAIEDRARQSAYTYVSEDPEHEFATLANGIQFDYWRRQGVYVEAWVEKEALLGPLQRACAAFHIPHMACKGYMSASEVWRAGLRYREAANQGRRLVLLHLGDHDPSGIDMTRDNGERLKVFARDTSKLVGRRSIDVRRLALNMDQIERYNPPPNIAKVTDSRWTDYIAEHGDESWELDALPPDVFRSIIEEEARTLIDQDVWDATEEKEQTVVSTLEGISARWDEIVDFVAELDEDD